MNTKTAQESIDIAALKSIAFMTGKRELYLALGNARPFGHGYKCELDCGKEYGLDKKKKQDYVQLIKIVTKINHDGNTICDHVNALGKPYRVIIRAYAHDYLQRSIIDLYINANDANLMDYIES